MSGMAELKHRNQMREETEDAIRALLIGLENETGDTIDFVRVDCRNFAGCKTEIFFKGE